MADDFDRCVAYLERLDPAISGSGGHRALYRAACVVQRFGLTGESAFRALKTYNSGCQPPFADRDLHHKLKDAERGVGDEWGELSRDPDASRAAAREAWGGPSPAPAPSRHEVRHGLLPLFAWLRQACDIRRGFGDPEPHHADEVRDYLDSRAFDWSTHDGPRYLGALPKGDEASALMRAMVVKFGAELVELSGLRALDRQTKKPIDRFAWPNHRLIVWWLDNSGRPYLCRRRSLDSGPPQKSGDLEVPRWVGCRGLGAALPLGWDALTQSARKGESPVVVCESESDWLALRALTGSIGSGDRIAAEYASQLDPNETSLSATLMRRLARRKLVEGPLWGDRIQVIAVPGAAAWRSVFERVWFERMRFVVAFDNDETGEVEGKKLCLWLREGGATSFYYPPPSAVVAHDWAAYWRAANEVKP